jgi:hypothetical protein
MLRFNSLSLNEDIENRIREFSKAKSLKMKDAIAFILSDYFDLLEKPKEIPVLKETLSNKFNLPYNPFLPYNEEVKSEAKRLVDTGQEVLVTSQILVADYLAKTYPYECVQTRSAKPLLGLPPRWVLRKIGSDEPLPPPDPDMKKETLADLGLE